MVDVKNLCVQLDIKLLDIGSVYAYIAKGNKQPFATNSPILVFVVNPDKTGHVGYVQKRKILSLQYVVDLLTKSD